MGWPNNLWKLYWGIIILSFWDMFIGVYALNVILLWKFQRVNTEQRSSDSRCSVRPIDNDSFQEGTQPISRTKRIGLVVQGRTVYVFTYHLSIIAVWSWHTFFFIYFFPFSEEKLVTLDTAAKGTLNSDSQVVNSLRVYFFV